MGEWDSYNNDNRQSFDFEHPSFCIYGTALNVSFVEMTKSWKLEI